MSTDVVKKRKGSTPAGQVRTPEENARYNEWQKQHRERTGNHRQRAYRRAEMKAARWVRENQPELWAALLAEELAKSEERPYCRHEHFRAIGVSFMCNDCHELLGVRPFDDTITQALAP